MKKQEWRAIRLNQANPQVREAVSTAASRQKEKEIRLGQAATAELKEMQNVQRE